MTLVVGEISEKSLPVEEEESQQRRPEDDVLKLLSTFPRELDLTQLPPLFSTLTKLNLTNCGLSSLPSNFHEAFPKLSILFLSNNAFDEMPAVIGKCQNLQMVAFKSNGMTSIHPDALQPQLRWLILTQNAIQELPETIGRCTKLQKLMLSGNRLTRLPDSIGNCRNLELVRLASNRLEQAPLQLLQELPHLAWVGLSDNPFLKSAGTSDKVPPAAPMVLTDLDEKLLREAQVLGSGAGGVTRKMKYHDKWVAVKEFGGTMTSDGLPSHERSISCQVSALQCPALVQVLGETTPSGCLVMEYLDNFHALAGPPSLASCSRDVYTVDNNEKWTAQQAQSVLAGLLDALVKLHKIGICHGDFYAHNILIRRHDSDSTTTIQARLTDFGAAFQYDTASTYGKLLQQIELRAFCHLVNEVKDNLVSSDDNDSVLVNLAAQCRKQGATFESVFIWLKQQQLKTMASAFGVDDEEEQLPN